jgi:ankyrin repeat protein
MLINYFQEGWTPLHVSCFNSNLEITEVLLDEGADPNNPDVVKASAFSCSVRSS